MCPRKSILTIAAAAACFAALNAKAAAQSITVTPGTPTITIGQTQQFNVPEISAPVDIQAGDYHVCIALQSGEARCTGGNSAGQLGNGSFTDSASPSRSEERRG